MKPPAFPGARVHARRRIPRWAWISAAFALVLVPVLLVWLTLALLGGAWQAGSGLTEQARGWLGLVAPEAAREADAALAQVREAAQALAPLAADPAAAARAAVEAKVAETGAALTEPLADASAELAAKAAAAATLAGAAALAGQEASAITERGQAALGAALGTLAPLPSADVVGEDPSGFERMPGFVRTAYQRGDGGVVATYRGVAAQAEVMAFHRQALEAAGHAAIVQSADAQHSVIEFRRDGQSLVLATHAEPGGRTRLEVRSN
jgi:hypothetical protein